MNIGVVVAEDFPLVRAALEGALSSDPAIRVVGSAGTGQEAVELSAEHQPDVVLLDLHLPDMSGLLVLEQVRERAPNSRVIIVTASEKTEPFLAAIAGGACGYLSKRVERAELVDAVISAHGGGTPISDRLIGCLASEYSTVSRGGSGDLHPLLSSREQQVLRAVALGHTDREISDQLFISPRTVQNHLASIRRKTGLRRRSELARWAADHVRV